MSQTTSSHSERTAPVEISQWSNIKACDMQQSLAELQKHVHPISTLLRYGYVIAGSSKAQAHRRATPTVDPGVARLSAVALDCEMVETIGNRSELVRLVAIDYLSGNIILDTFVRPPQKVTNWRTKITGITSNTLKEAERNGQIVFGWEACRAELWKIIDSNTILVGQSLNNDLKALRMTHTTIVDSQILTSLAIDRGQQQLGLAQLCKELPCKTIRNQTSVHNSLEDAFAAREVVLWCLNNPEGLRQWARTKR